MGSPLQRPSIPILARSKSTPLSSIFPLTRRFSRRRDLSSSKVRTSSTLARSREDRRSATSRFSTRAESGGRRSASSVGDRKSTRLNSSHVEISYAVFCLKKKKKKQNRRSTKHHTSH